MRRTPGRDHYVAPVSQLRVPERLWTRLRADPLRAPEHIALAAAEFHAPAAEAWAARRQRTHGWNRRSFAEMARRRHAAMAAVEGAATGVGGVVTLVPDLVGLAWIQSRLVFFVAAAYGHDPHDPLRPAELLFLNRLYPDVEGARAALDGVGASVAQAWIGGQLARQEALALRLTTMLAKSGGKHFGGRLIPGFAIAYNAVANRAGTNTLGRRAIAYYGGPVPTLLTPAEPPR
jgi:hypothetical protein